MKQIIDFVKGNIGWVVMGVAAVLLLVVMLVVFLKRPKKVASKAAFEKEVERFDRRHMKPCKSCGEKVPVDDNICQSCGQIPN
jgi:hypothetical protein